jgi:hypothetical protein
VLPVVLVELRLQARQVLVVLTAVPLRVALRWLVAKASLVLRAWRE